MKCFFDGSNPDSSDGRPWLTLAGLVAGESFWDRFNNGWRVEVLQKRAPYAPYLHMRELYSSKSKFKDFTQQRRNDLIFDAVDYLQRLPKLAFCGIVCTIDLRSRAKLVALGCLISDPHVICAECCIGTAFKWRFDNHPDGVEPVSIYFDRKEKFMHPFRQRWLCEKKKQRPVITDAFWGLISDVGAKEMPDTPALQVADMLAWATGRRHAGLERRMLFLMDIIEKVVPSARFILDEAVMLEKYWRGAPYHDAQP
jgi:hypothetical protein